MRLIPTIVLLGLITSTATITTAQTLLIDFESFPGMTNSPGQIVPAASRLSTQLIATHGVKFSSAGGFVAVVVHNGPTPSAPNIIGGSTAASALSYTQIVTISFFDPANPTSAATTDFVQVRGDQIAVAGSATMNAYSVAGALIATNTVSDTSAGLTLPISMPGIHRVELTQTSGTIGYDDLSFHAVTPCATIASYCTAGTTTHGCNALIAAVGTPSASAASGFLLSATSVEGQKQGLFFYGVSGPMVGAWGNSSSFLCIKSPTQRMTTSNSGGTSGACDGSLTIDWNAFRAANPTALGAPFAGGDTVSAQCWFRDPASSKTTSLSNALQFSVCP